MRIHSQPGSDVPWSLFGLCPKPCVSYSVVATGILHGNVWETWVPSFALQKGGIVLPAMNTSRGEKDRFAPDLALKTSPKPDSGEGLPPITRPPGSSSQESAFDEERAKIHGLFCPRRMKKTLAHRDKMEGEIIRGSYVRPG